MEIPIKAKVLCADGPGGEATRLIVHPASKRVTRMVIREAKPPHIERVVPFKFFEDATVDQIRLRCSLQELSKMQTFFRTEFVETSWSADGRMPAEIKKVKRQNIEEDELALDTGMRVKATDGNLGRIDELMVEPASGSITHLMLHRGYPWTRKEMMVPITDVDRIVEKAVYLKKNRADVASMPAASERGR